MTRLETGGRNFDGYQRRSEAFQTMNGAKRQLVRLNPDLRAHGRLRRCARTSRNRRKNVKALMIAAVAAGCLTLAACGGKGDDALGEQAQENMENKADALDAAADNMSGPAADQLEAQADATREAGDAKEEAIDDADLNADAMTPAEKNAVTAAH
jgi:hypothetical protein